VQVSDGARSLLATVPAPVSSIALPDNFASSAISRFEATGTDAMGATVVWGSTIPYSLTGIAGYGVWAFVGRAGGWSRAPGTLGQFHFHSLVAPAFSKYVIAVGGDPVAASAPTVLDSYDMDVWAPFQGMAAPLPRSPKSLVIGYAPDPDGVDIDIEMLSIDDTDASWFNISLGVTDVTFTPPPGLDLAEIAGGETIPLPDGTVYVIGATRSVGAATSKVLRIDATGQFQVLSLTTPRQGAAAAAIGKSLVVAGGAAEGAGAEVLDPAENAFVPLALPADPIAGLGIAGLSPTTAILVGGADPSTGTPGSVRTFDVTCATANCGLNEVATLPIPLVRTKGFSLQAGKTLVLGESDDGENHAFLLDTSSDAPSVLEKPLREPRKGATPVLLPNSQVGLVGGQRTDSGAPSLTIEVFFP